ncbi:DUF418 domain-containing protein [Kineococcus glutinatus]|uniref:DUF418 domain-containing protein n=1 Tax=Kineococcus glutinatus TaxID=1070872 RepID=A0ABP9I398_9ACTN
MARTRVARTQVAQVARTPVAPAQASTPVSQRVLAPDVARGAMLLLIALANAHLYVTGRELGFRGYPAPEVMGAAERVVTAVQLTLVDGRAFPLFSLLFGYGVVQLARRRRGAGSPEPAVVRLVRRRGWWMLLIGAVHGVLLWPGDVVGAYGLIAVLFAGALVRGRLRALLVAGVLLVALAGAGEGLRTPGGTTAMVPSLGEDDVLPALGYRLLEWPSVGVLAQGVGLVGAVAAGAWAARRRLLDEPARHRRLLVRVAVAGVLLAVAGGLPLALIASGVWAGPSLGAQALAGAAHGLGGYAGGAGYAALFGLLAARAVGAGQRPGPVVTALAACGQRSLSCYLAQSVLFCAVLVSWGASWGGGLAPRGGLVVTAAVAAATWALTVLLARALHARDRRGPAEVLLRRLTYGGRSGVPVTVDVRG